MAIHVLFLCTGNSARSLIAEAMLKKMGGDPFEVSSAGTHPKGINPYTEQVLLEGNIDVSAMRSKHMAEFADRTFDYVITVCDQAAEQCPIFPGDPKRIHWKLPDSAAVEGTDEQKLHAFRRTLKEMGMARHLHPRGGAKPYPRLTQNSPRDGALLEGTIG